MKNYISLDIGGTSISASVVSANGKFLLPILRFPAYSCSDKNNILINFSKIINTLFKKAELLKIPIDGIGIGFPGPFDYKNGISLIKGINKYDSLYGVNIKKELTALLGKKIDIRFCNDADLYCMGECVYGVGKSYKRCMCVCIGTGIGSGFFADGELITSGKDVPENGWIFRTPYKDGIADEYLSASGIRKMIKKHSELKDIPDVKELAQAAFNKNEAAVQIFKEFGIMLAEVVEKFAVGFNAQCLILGGEVSRSHVLFEEPLKTHLKKQQIKVLPSVSFSNNTLLACALLFK